MDKKLGTITQISCSYERKISDGEYGSVGGFFSVTMDLGNNVNPDTAMDGLYEWVKVAATRNMKPSFDAIVEKKSTKPATVSHDDAPPFPPAPEVEEAEALEPMEVVKWTLARRTDGNYQLELYQKYGDKVGKYPDLKYTAGQVEMWDMLKPVIKDEDFSQLPVEYECKWLADWQHGREYKKQDGTVGRYKDLVELRLR